MLQKVAARLVSLCGGGPGGHADRDEGGGADAARLHRPWQLGRDREDRVGRTLRGDGSFNFKLGGKKVYRRRYLSAAGSEFVDWVASVRCKRKREPQRQSRPEPRQAAAGGEDRHERAEAQARRSIRASCGRGDARRSWRWATTPEATISRWSGAVDGVGSSR
jgi:hypothetical protein